MYKRIILALIVLFFFLVSPIRNIKAEEKIKEIDISTSPHKVFFDIQNGRPGDTYIRKLNIQNNGMNDYKYIFTNKFLTGSEQFYDVLLLTVSDSSGEIFKGKIRDFDKLDARFLKKNANEDLEISVHIPIEIGNEYQSLNSEFQFKFYVEGTLGGVLPVDGPKLPSTGTNMFNILAAGAVLVLTGSIFQFFIKRRRKIMKET